jgi:hypothetical protein
MKRSIEELKKYIFSRRVLPALLVMGIIIYMSSIPGCSLPAPWFKNMDKLVHFGFYGLLAISIAGTIYPEGWRRYGLRIVLAIIVFSTLFGIADELYQKTVQGRYPSKMDVLADSLGAAFGAFGYYRLRLWRVFFPAKVWRSTTPVAD